MARESGFQVAGSAAASYERAMSVFMTPWSVDLVARAQLRQGMEVLDLACGTGLAARRAKDVVGVNGRVVGVDINPQMVATARDVTGLVVHQAPAEETGLPAEAFDVAMCQQSLQFFSDPAAALREMRRVLRPGGRVVLSVWEDFGSNPYFASQYRALEPHLSDQDAAAYRASDITTLGGVDGLETLLSGSGFAHVAIERCTLDIEFPPMATFVPLHTAAIPMGSAFHALSPTEKDTVISEMNEALHASDADEKVVVPMSSWVATASSPSGATPEHVRDGVPGEV